MAKLAHYSVHDGNILILDVVDNNLADRGFAEQLAVPQEEQVASLERRFHASAEDDDDGGWRVGDDGETFPHLCK